MAHQSPPPSATSGHHNPPNSDPGDQPSASGSSVLANSNPELNLSPPLPSRNPAIYRLSFDQDYKLFAAGLDDGYRIFSVNPFNLMFRTRAGGVQLVAMLFRSDCKYICLVGGGPNPMVEINKVFVVGGDQSEFVRGLSFPSEVKNVRFREDRVIFVMVQSMFVFNFRDLTFVQLIETCMNPKGLCEISNSPFPMVIAYPGVPEGQIIVYYYGSHKTRILKAHDSAISCMAMTPNGILLASACDKGDLIRIFSTLNEQLLLEIASGYERAEIYSLAFSSKADWLAVSSDKGTVLVFNLDADSEPTVMSQFRIPEGLQHFVGFGYEKNTVVIIGMDGSFYRCEFDPKAIGREMIQLEHHNFMEREMT